MADLAFRVQHVIKTEIDVTQAQLSRNGIEMINGMNTPIDSAVRYPPTVPISIPPATEMSVRS